MLIIKITLDPRAVNDNEPTEYKIGEAPNEYMNTVEKIKYFPCSRVFNKGLEIGSSCYAIYFKDVEERKLILECVVTTLEVVKEPKSNENNTESFVELPE